MKIRIEPIKFVCLRTGKESFGVKVSDAHEIAFYESDEPRPVKDDMDLIRWCACLPNDTIKDIFHFLEMRKGDVEIGDTTYSWNQIRPCLEHVEMEV